MAGSVPTKYRMAHLINGTLDSANIAPMGGVTTYPYKVNEKLYQDECVAASRPHDHALPCLVQTYLRNRPASFIASLVSPD